VACWPGCHAASQAGVVILRPASAPVQQALCKHRHGDEKTLVVGMSFRPPSALPLSARTFGACSSSFHALVGRRLSLRSTERATSGFRMTPTTSVCSRCCSRGDALLSVLLLATLRPGGLKRYPAGVVWPDISCRPRQSPGPTLPVAETTPLQALRDAIDEEMARDEPSVVSRGRRRVTAVRTKSPGTSTRNRGQWRGSDTRSPEEQASPAWPFGARMTACGPMWKGHDMGFLFSPSTDLQQHGGLLRTPAAATTRSPRCDRPRRRGPPARGEHAALEAYFTPLARHQNRGGEHPTTPRGDERHAAKHRVFRACVLTT